MESSVLLVLAWLMTGPDQAQVPDRPAEDVYRNIQVLKGKRAPEVRPLMDEFSRALGVDCTYCHVSEQWHLEDKPQLATARGMFQMVTALGEGRLADRGGLTCWTCHRGQSKPSRFPGAELDAELAKWPADLVGATDGMKLTMTVYARSLGVTCEYCHVTSDWTSHAKAPIRVVPTMLALFEEMPKYSKAAANRSQCWMCHKGSTSPERHPKGLAPEAPDTASGSAGPRARGAHDRHLPFAPAHD